MLRKVEPVGLKGLILERFRPRAPRVRKLIRRKLHPPGVSCVYWLAEFCVRRPVFALMIVMALVVAGVASFPELGVDRYPSMDLPTIYVRTTYPGAAPEEVESECSQLIEDAVATVSGIDELRSISSDGQSIVLVTFNLTRNLDAAAQD